MCIRCRVVGVIVREAVTITCRHGKTIIQTVLTNAVERTEKSKMSLYLCTRSQNSDDTTK